MSDHTDIEWTGATWNIITGCDIESPGCIHCYAMGLAGTRLRNHPSRIGLTKQAANGAHVWTGEVRFNEQWLDQPLRWQRPRSVFVVAHGDLFHPSVPDEWIDKVFAVMARARWHTYQVLTKRAKRMREYMSLPDRYGRIIAASHEIHTCAMEAMPWPLPNVWMGVSAEDQQRFDERIIELHNTPAAVRWLSIEPMIGPIDAEYPASVFPDGPRMCCDGRECSCRGGPIDPPLLYGIDWVVVGGESGPKARPMHLDWARSLRDQCAAAGAAFFMKQIISDRKKKIPFEQWDADLQIREFPNASR